MDCYRKVLLICYCQVKPFRLFCKTEEILVCETAKICSSLDSSALHLLGCVACTQRRAFIVACVDQAPCQAGGMRTPGMPALVFSEFTSLHHGRELGGARGPAGVGEGWQSAGGAGPRTRQPGRLGEASCCPLAQSCPCSSRGLRASPTVLPALCVTPVRVGCHLRPPVSPVRML